jgi:hypothetical protein
MRLEVLADMEQRARNVQVVGVEPRLNRAGGAQQTAMDGVGLAAIFLADPVRQVRRETLDDPGRAIGRSR